jgi:hypothetical protein
MDLLRNKIIGNVAKQTLEKTEKVIKNRKSRDTTLTTLVRQDTRRRQTKHKNTTQKPKKIATQTPPKKQS